MSASPAGAALAHGTESPDTPQTPLLLAIALHYHALVERVRHRFGRAGLAHAVVHEAWLQIRERPPTGPIHAPLGWLHHRLHDLAVDHCRRNDRRAAREQDTEVLFTTACPLPTPDLHLDIQREITALADAIDALPPRCREVFILHKVHDLPQQEVAQLLVISPRTVEKHVRLGLAACRQRLAAFGR